MLLPVDAAGRGRNGGEFALARFWEKRHNRPMNTTKNLNRRAFLKSTATLVTAAPFLLPSRIWAAETPPSARLNLGFVGTGTQGKGLMGGFLGKKETQT